MSASDDSENNKKEVNVNVMGQFYDSCKYFGEFLNVMKSRQPTSTEETELVEGLKAQMREFLTDEVSSGNKKEPHQDAVNLKYKESNNVNSGAISKNRRKGEYLGFGEGTNVDQIPIGEAGGMMDCQRGKHFLQADHKDSQGAGRLWRKPTYYNTDPDSSDSDTDDGRKSTSSDESYKLQRPGRDKNRNIKRHKASRSLKHSIDDKVSQNMLGSMGTFVDHRQPPKLEKFSEDSGQSFVKFLDKFERYCEQNIRGGDEFWLGVLEEHLEGKMLKNFRIIRKQYDEYGAVVEQLLGWYKESADLRRRKLMKQFKQMVPESKETLYGFSMRLFNAFRAAKPKHRNFNASKTLMKRFVKAIPKKASRSLKAKIASHRLAGYKPDWAFYQKCAKMADLYEDSSEESNSSVSEVEVVEVNLGKPDAERVRHHFGPRAREVNNMHGRRGRCYTCGAVGHFASRCWWNLGLCASCGSSEHFISACPNRAAASQSAPQRQKDQQGEYGNDVFRYSNNRGRGQVGGFRGRSFRGTRGRGTHNNGERGSDRGRHQRGNSWNNEYGGEQLFASGANRENIRGGNRGVSSRGGPVQGYASEVKRSDQSNDSGAHKPLNW